MRFFNSKTLTVLLIALVALIAAWNWRLSDPPALKSVRDITFDTYQRIAPLPFDPNMDPSIGQ